jgi:hypothetical protein
VPETWLRTKDIAAALHVSPKTVTRWATDPDAIPAEFVRRTLRGHRRYDPRLLDHAQEIQARIETAQAEARKRRGRRPS